MPHRLLSRGAVRIAVIKYQLQNIQRVVVSTLPGILAKTEVRHDDTQVN